MKTRCTLMMLMFLTMLVGRVNAQMSNEQELQTFAKELNELVKEIKNLDNNLDQELHALDSVKADTTYVQKVDTTELKIGKTRVVIIGEPKIERIYTDEDEDDEDDEDDAEERAERREAKEFNKKSLKNYKNSYFTMDIGLNSYLQNNSFSLDATNPLSNVLELNRAKSVNFSLYFITGKLNLYKHNLHFVYRAGIDWNNYRFTNDTAYLTPGTNKMESRVDYNNGKLVRYTKSKLVSEYLTVPLLLHYQNYTKRGKVAFQLSGGVELGYLIDSRIKLVTEDDQTIKKNDDFNLNPTRLGFVGRIGYRDLVFYGKYYPTTTFVQGRAPELNTFVFGVSLFGF